jgi:hypothetical protein
MEKENIRVDDSIRSYIAKNNRDDLHALLGKIIYTEAASELHHNLSASADGKKYKASSSKLSYPQRRTLNSKNKIYNNWFLRTLLNKGGSNQQKSEVSRFCSRIYLSFILFDDDKIDNYFKYNLSLEKWDDNCNSIFESQNEMNYSDLEFFYKYCQLNQQYIRRNAGSLVQEGLAPLFHACQQYRSKR